MRVLGVMSGTSLDGLDLALCEFFLNGEKYTYKIIKAKTLKYNNIWRKKLEEGRKNSLVEFLKLNVEYGEHIGIEIKKFLYGQQKPDAIASHGHTVFHQPQNGFTTQIGCGANIAAVTGITTVCDFRSLDVALRGQGAPLVPIGDEKLFSDYGACLNLGGIANISFKKGNKRIAYDICEANMLLNYLSNKAGKNYDKGGAMAEKGSVEKSLLKKLNKKKFYKEKAPKSLGREWFEKNILPQIENQNIKLTDLLATASQHIAEIISDEINNNGLKKILVTGGGAYNKDLIERINSRIKYPLVVLDDLTIKFKEALIFAFLGYLRLNEEINTLSSVTGAKKDSSGGAIYLR